MSEPLLVIENLNGYYGTAHVLQDVSFSMGVEPVAMIGRNGMGKTTLCKAIVGLLGATGHSDGSVRLEGTEIHGRPSYKIAKGGVGYVPQGRRLFTSLTVDEHLQIVGASSKAAWTPARVYELFPRLAERKQQRAGTLSGGEQQMVAIGRALMAHPKLLLLDEPSMGLAPIFVERIFEIIRTINAQGTPILLVEQNALMALDVASRGYVLETGTVALTDEAKRLKENEQVQKTYLGAD
jgi:branched-chain amino acid transport system ATP-binding protein